MAKERAEGVLKDVREDLQQLGSDLQGAAKKQLKDLGGRAADYYERGKERVSDYEERFESSIRERPVRAVLIAVGVGALLGLFLFRRR
jgi:ElaB/YqjD/DUF883 family membrane-anchored ribosome-binding protein